MLLLSSSLLPSSSIPEERIWVKPLQIEYKIILVVLTGVPLMSPLYLGHEKSSESTTSLNRTFIKTVTILREDNNFRGKL